MNDHLEELNVGNKNILMATVYPNIENEHLCLLLIGFFFFFFWCYWWLGHNFRIWKILIFQPVLHSVLIKIYLTWCSTMYSLRILQFKYPFYSEFLFNSWNLFSEDVSPWFVWFNYTEMIFKNHLFHHLILLLV